MSYTLRENTLDGVIASAICASNPMMTSVYQPNRAFDKGWNVDVSPIPKLNMQSQIRKAFQHGGSKFGQAHLNDHVGFMIFENPLSQGA